MMASTTGICPQSGTKGKRVDTATVKCLVSVSLTEVKDTQYYFCREAQCPIVYFSDDGSHFFSVADLRERVYQKEPESSTVQVCYCFRYTLEDIRRDAETFSASTIIEVINAGIKAGQCACDWRNPQGDCCLGNVRALLT